MQKVTVGTYWRATRHCGGEENYPLDSFEKSCFERSCKATIAYEDVGPK